MLRSESPSAIGAPWVSGFGSLVFDQIITPGQRCTEPGLDQASYAGGRGGGSVWNVLANLAFVGFRCKAAGWGGDDVFGRAAVQDLEFLGIDAEAIFLSTKTSTRLIFEVQGGAGRRDHLFTEQCPACKKRHKSRTNYNNKPMPNRLGSESSALIVDDLNRSATWELMMEFRRDSDVLAAVLDHPSSYRYTPISKIIGKLKSIDVIFMKDRVYDSFRGRTARSGLGDLKTILAANDRLRILVSTRGAEGADAWICMPGRDWVERWVPAPDVPLPTDTAGAGDAFFGRFLSEYLPVASAIARLNDSEAAVTKISEILGDSAKAISPVLMSDGARGHLPAPPTPPPFAEIMGMPLSELREQNGKSHCPLCLASRQAPLPKPKESRRVGMRETGGPYLRSRAMFSMENAPLAEARNLLKISSRTYVVGTGGSFPAATFIAYALSEYGNHHAEAIKPHDLVARGGKADTIVVVSSSGKTPDCGRALQAAARKGARRAILITAAQEPALRQFASSFEDFQILRIRGRERGFISFAGTVNPAIVFAVAADLNPFKALEFCETDSQNVAPIAGSVANSLIDSPVVHAIGTSWAWPALLDLESKFTEGNLGTVHLHEAKDFSHGRFMRVLGNDKDRTPILLFRTGERDKYVDFMVRKLKTTKQFYVVESSSPGIGGGLDLMFATQRLVLEIAGRLGRDISRPRNIPSKGLELYHWS